MILFEAGLIAGDLIWVSVSAFSCCLKGARKIRAFRGWVLYPAGWSHSALGILSAIDFKFLTWDGTARYLPKETGPRSGEALKRATRSILCTAIILFLRIRNGFSRVRIMERP